MRDVTHVVTPSPCHKLSQFLRPLPYSVTYFMDGPYGQFWPYCCTWRSVQRPSCFRIYSPVGRQAYARVSNSACMGLWFNVSTFCLCTYNLFHSIERSRDFESDSLVFAWHWQMVSLPLTMPLHGISGTPFTTNFPLKPAKTRLWRNTRYDSPILHVCTAFDTTTHPRTSLTTIVVI